MAENTLTEDVNGCACGCTTNVGEGPHGMDPDGICSSFYDGCHCPHPATPADAMAALELATCADCAEDLGATGQTLGGICENCYAKSARDLEDDGS